MVAKHLSFEMCSCGKHAWFDLWIEVESGSPLQHLRMNPLVSKAQCREKLVEVSELDPPQDVFLWGAAQLEGLALPEEAKPPYEPRMVRVEAEAAA